MAIGDISSDSGRRWRICHRGARLVVGIAALLLVRCQTVVIRETIMVTPTPSISDPAPETAVEPAPALTVPPSPIPTIAIPLLTPTLSITMESEAAVDVSPWPLAGSELPDPVVPEPFGVEIHFTQATRREFDLLRDAGFRWVRMDMFWGDVERSPGHYDFAAYDRLVQALSERGMRMVFILDYGNVLYDSGHPPTSDAGRAAFARFAATAARRYRDRGIIWEIWNEPNLAQFWHPEPNAANYARLALATIAAIRRVDPTATIVGPALVSFPADYWQDLARLGVLSRLDAVTVHPYGLPVPEDVVPHYVWLRRLLDAYSPGRTIPILVSEWGYASVQGGISEEVQAQYVLRQWLVNLAHDVNLSIWYDWRNDGVDPAEVEQNFGLVMHDYRLKPAYRAVRTLTATLTGYRFVRRVALENPADYLVLFRRDAQIAAAAWTTAEQHTLSLPLPVDRVQVVDMVGRASESAFAGDGIPFSLSQSPQILLLGGDDIVLRLGVWGPCRTIQHLTPDLGMQVCVQIANPFASSLQAEIEVWSVDHLLGRAAVSAPPGEVTRVWVPIAETGQMGDVAASIVLFYPDQALQSLQRAPVWLLIDGP